MIIQELKYDETNLVAGGCPLDLRDSGISAEDAAEICRELERTQPRSPGGGSVEGTSGTKVYTATRIPRGEPDPEIP
ncbi:hypothetical protein [Kordiimonas laminariae]|uniref:hypothetical protein n=1 Tax=Kordiimonas laminariae TaxID=2917717 RepID=UPI001FF1BD95|nr:hypothetical protein [Kordiimonas laminariae]MCK0069622.1 hypothetical protein [Kordiimonas laminariae]